MFAATIRRFRTLRTLSIANCCIGVLFSCVAPAANASPMPAKPAVGAIYLNNGTANPFANVAPVDIPATAQSGYGRSVAVGALVNPLYERDRLIEAHRAAGIMAIFFEIEHEQDAG